jgi:hypothetical protein
MEKKGTVLIWVFINVMQIAEALMLPLTKEAFFLKVNKIPDRPS